MTQQNKKGNETLNKLLKLAEEKPELIENLLQLASGVGKKEEGPSVQEAQKVLDDLLSGKPIELEKGPIVDEVFQGLSICATCGKEQKTYTSNPNGIVTQHVCTRCKSEMALMKTDAERFQFFQEGLANDFLGAAKAKFKVMLSKFKKNREREVQKLQSQKGDGPDPMNFSVTGGDK